MKQNTSNQVSIETEERLRAVTVRALSAEKTARLEKEKARSAKRRLKEARKAYKLAKKTAKKAIKRARRAQEELKACVDRAANARNRRAMQARHASVKRAKAGGVTPPVAKAPLAQAPAVRKEPSRSTRLRPSTSEPQPSPEFSMMAAGL